MSKFNSYAKKLDEIARAAFKEYRQTEAAYIKAEARSKEYPVRGGMVSADYAAEAARAQADFLEAQAAYKTALRNFGAAQEKSIRELRSELAAAVEDAFSADPAQLDGNTLELLKSGILTASEYAKLMIAAHEAGNATMVRMIGKYAQDAADTIATKYGVGDPKAKELRNVAYQSRAYTGSVYLNNFDVITDVYNRCTRNPALIDKWDELTGEMVNQF